MYRKKFDDREEVQNLGGGFETVNELDVFSTNLEPGGGSPLVIIRVTDPDDGGVEQVDLRPAKARKVARAILKAADKAEGI